MIENEYTLQDNYRALNSATSEGTQIKFKMGNEYFKIDKVGHEGLVEYLVTLLLEHSTITPDRYAHYSMCKINGNNGCKSLSFLADDEEFVAVHSLYKKVTGKVTLANDLSVLQNAEDRLKLLLDTVAVVGVNPNEFKEYVSTVMQLDMLIENPDRHHHNYGVVYNHNTGALKPAPIFDNGQALHTSNQDSYCGATISGSFEEQVTTFGFPITPKFRIDYDGVMEAVKDLMGYSETKFMLSQLERYKSMFKGNRIQILNAFI
ncbi:hypothetical protein [Acetivibrio ethanolgignens]|uniref:HipA-like C-terminal domain-containing protein n=1 Tax=Acetivibrio ethanolgignens TaxID=290052 RepID=A0A0V8QCD6_9FIRM|nr:hypothetical protein [Acetivibrio ethanolgignens]KSV58257.1 hypothetical protein ASU35_13420 [Acetivibrio ethanolgignens]